MLCISLHCITSKSFVQIGTDLGECSKKNHTEQVQLECYTNF